MIFPLIPCVCLGGQQPEERRCWPLYSQPLHNRHGVRGTLPPQHRHMTFTICEYRPCLSFAIPLFIICCPSDSAVSGSHPKIKPWGFINIFLNVLNCCRQSSKTNSASCKAALKFCNFLAHKGRFQMHNDYSGAVSAFLRCSGSATLFGERWNLKQYKFALGIESWLLLGYRQKAGIPWASEIIKKLCRAMFCLSRRGHRQHDCHPVGTKASSS